MRSRAFAFGFVCSVVTTLQIPPHVMGRRWSELAPASRVGLIASGFACAGGIVALVVIGRPLDAGIVAFAMVFDLALVRGWAAASAAGSRDWIQANARRSSARRARRPRAVRLDATRASVTRS
jgi:hypothetical protein